ncbi:MAG: hypothetical protein CBC48_07645 [bacterium TMED88]|nr:RNA polymerase subunit sigma-24 [Deltaproteobacteria bacterium]OUV32796.1 MAG: hypothetical protein CBC48_07645 [bacterium TMED88]
MSSRERRSTADSQARARDRSLLEGLRRGEDEAFRALVDANTGPMLAVARRFLRNEDDARDAVQDAYLSAFRSIDRFEGDALLSTWLHRIVVNACLMRLRTRRRRPETSIEDLLPGFLENGRLAVSQSAKRDRADHVLEARQQRALVTDAIDRLPDIYRTVLILRDIEGFDTEQTAGVLELSVPAVKTRLHRARQALKELLDRQVFDRLEAAKNQDSAPLVQTAEEVDHEMP